MTIEEIDRLLEMTHDCAVWDKLTIGPDPLAIASALRGLGVAEDFLGGEWRDIRQALSELRAFKAGQPNA